MSRSGWFKDLEEVSFEGRFYFLLLTIVLFIVFDPLQSHNRVITTTLGSLVLLSAIACLSLPHSRSFLASRWFGAFVLLAGWVAVTSDNDILRAGYSFAKIVFLVFVSGALIYQTARAKEVTLPVIVGAIDGYLLLGLIGAAGYSVAEALAPGSLQLPPDTDSTTSVLYFSFVTLTTLG